jgi:hypothetical protein
MPITGKMKISSEQRVDHRSFLGISNMRWFILWNTQEGLQCCQVFMQGYGIELSFIVKGETLEEVTQRPWST